jgi:hypothetical protein
MSNKLAEMFCERVEEEMCQHPKRLGVRLWFTWRGMKLCGWCMAREVR